jgi:hypothetical protein
MQPATCNTDRSCQESKSDQQADTVLLGKMHEGISDGKYTSCRYLVLANVITQASQFPGSIKAFDVPE